MKKQLLVFLMLACIGLSANAQRTTLFNNLFRANKIVSSSAIMGKSNTLYKPGKEINYNWDSASNIWIPNDTNVWTFNSSGNITKLLNYNGASLPTKTLYYYNANGKETSDTSFNSSNAYSNAVIFTYDANGNTIKELHKGYYNTGWQNSYENDYTYDVNNNQTEYIEYYTRSGNGYLYGYKTITTWFNGQITEQVNQQYSASTWTNSSKTDFTYTNGKVSGGTNFSWTGTTWLPTQNYNSIVWYQWNGNINTSKMGSYTGQIPNGNGWRDSTKYTLTYDSYGNVTDELNQAKTSISWITSYEYKYIYQYDANNNVTQKIEQDWVNASIGLLNNIKTVNSDYQSFTTTGVEQISSSKNDFVVFPNPSNGIINLQTSNGQLATSNEYKIEIYNLVGEIVYSTTNNKLQTLNEIDLSTQPKGIYFIQITDGNSVVNMKIQLK